MSRMRRDLAGSVICCMKSSTTTTASAPEQQQIRQHTGKVRDTLKDMKHALTSTHDKTTTQNIAHTNRGEHSENGEGANGLELGAVNQLEGLRCEKHDEATKLTMTKMRVRPMVN